MDGGALDDLIVRVYDLVVRRPLATFKSDALAVLAESLDFESAIWASGVHRTNTIFSIATYRFAPAALIDYAARWQPEDTLRSAVVASPGRARACSRRSRKRARFARPVSGSWNAWKESWRSSSFCCVTSTMKPRLATGDRRSERPPTAPPRGAP